MANGDWTWYGNGPTGLLSATAARRIDWANDTLKVMLTTSAYVPDQDAHDFKDDVTNEVTGTGYTAGGVTVTGKTGPTYDAASNEVRLVMGNNVWGPGATITARVAVLYKDTGTAATSPLIAFLIFTSSGTTAADKVVSNGTLTITNNATATLKGVVS